MNYCEKHKSYYHTLCVDCKIINYGAGPTESYYPPGAVNRVDMVNSPDHYKGKVECIDAIEAAIEGLEPMEAMCTGNAIKYLFRWKKKGGIEDLRKAKWYIQRIIDGSHAN